MKEKVIEIGTNYIRTKKGRWIYEERGLFIEDKIKQLKTSQELPQNNIVHIKDIRCTGTRKLEKKLNV